MKQEHNIDSLIVKAAAIQHRYNTTHQHLIDEIRDLVGLNDKGDQIFSDWVKDESNPWRVAIHKVDKNLLRKLGFYKGDLTCGRIAKTLFKAKKVMDEEQ